MAEINKDGKKLNSQNVAGTLQEHLSSKTESPEHYQELIESAFEIKDHTQILQKLGIQPDKDFKMSLGKIFHHAELSENAITHKIAESVLKELQASHETPSVLSKLILISKGSPLESFHVHKELDNLKEIMPQIIASPEFAALKQRAKANAAREGIGKDLTKAERDEMKISVIMEKLGVLVEKTDEKDSLRKGQIKRYLHSLNKYSASMDTLHTQWKIDPNMTVDDYANHYNNNGGQTLTRS